MTATFRLFFVFKEQNIVRCLNCKGIASVLVPFSEQIECLFVQSTVVSVIPACALLGQILKFVSKMYMQECFTSGLVSGEDSLALSDDLLSNIAELLLLLRSEEGVCVRHPDSLLEGERATHGER